MLNTRVFGIVLLAVGSAQELPFPQVLPSLSQDLCGPSGAHSLSTVPGSDCVSAV